MNIINIQSEEEFFNLAREKDLVLYFKAHGCGVCEAFYPKTLAALEDLDINFIPIQIEDFRKISGQLSVFMAPTILILKRGQEVYRESRFIDLNKVKNKLLLLDDWN